MLSKYSLVRDSLFISLLFLIDIFCLGIVEQPWCCLVRIGYLYFLFDRYAGWPVKLIAGVHVLLVAVVRAGLLERELIVLLLLYATVTFIRPSIQLSPHLWILCVLIITLGQQLYIEGMLGEKWFMVWTIKTISVTFVSSMFCLWLGRKVGRAIA